MLSSWLSISNIIISEYTCHTCGKELLLGRNHLLHNVFQLTDYCESIRKVLIHNNDVFEVLYKKKSSFHFAMDLHVLYLLYVTCMHIFLVIGDFIWTDGMCYFSITFIIPTHAWWSFWRDAHPNITVGVQSCWIWTFFTINSHWVRNLLVLKKISKHWDRTL